MAEIKVNVGGLWKALNGAPKVRVAGAWKTVTGVAVKEGGLWKTAYGVITPSSGALAVDPISAKSGNRVGAGMCWSEIVTAVATGGTGPYTYAWSKVSGSDLGITTPTAASTTFYGAVLRNSNITARYKVTVTDSLAATAEATVDLTLNGSNANPTSTFVIDGKVDVDGGAFDLTDAIPGDFIMVIAMNASGGTAAPAGTGSGDWNYIPSTPTSSDTYYRQITAADIASPPTMPEAGTDTGVVYVVMRGPVNLSRVKASGNFFSGSYIGLTIGGSGFNKNAETSQLIVEGEVHNSGTVNVVPPSPVTITLLETHDVLDGYQKLAKLWKADNPSAFVNGSTFGLSGNSYGSYSLYGMVYEVLHA